MRTAWKLHGSTCWGKRWMNCRAGMATSFVVPAKTMALAECNASVLEGEDVLIADSNAEDVGR